MERRLTTILAADVAGYSRLTGKDEASGPASFRAGLIDRLYSLDQDSLVTGARIQ